jgi:YfiR/HmsC-like
MPRLSGYLCRHRSGSGLLACVCALVWALAAPALQAQVASEAAVKAGFVYNFIKFTQWPGPREGAPIRLCAASALPLDGQLSLLQGRSVGSRLIDVRLATPPADWRLCDVLFLGEGDADRLPLMQQRVAHAPVLTLGDLPGFVDAGGMIGLRVEASRVRFDVHLGSAQQSGLVLNSQMLKLAGKVVP